MEGILDSYSPAPSKCEKMLSKAEIFGQILADIYWLNFESSGRSKVDAVRLKELHDWVLGLQPKDLPDEFCAEVTYLVNQVSTDEITDPVVITNRIQALVQLKNKFTK